MTADNKKQIYYELVFVLLNNEIAAEFLYTEFSKVLEKNTQMAQFAAEKVQCVYAAVSNKLALHGAVCFELQFDEHGAIDSGFAVPLQHLLSTAGAGPDFGMGPIRLASRSQCPISWQAQNLWEPEGQDMDNPLHKVQQALWKNRLGLVITNDPPNQGVCVSSSVSRLNLGDSEQKIDQALDEEGRISLQVIIRQHTTQIESLKSGFRDDFVKQQEEHFLQVRKSREEVQQLKVELRMEQQRSLRLQQLLRGESRL